MKNGLPYVFLKNPNLYIQEPVILSLLRFSYLFLAVLDLYCCALDFLQLQLRGLLFVALCGLLLAVASFAAEHKL